MLDQLRRMFEKKESAVGPLRAGFQLGSPVYRAKAGEARDKFAEESMQAVVAYAAVRLVAKSFASVNWYPAREMADGELEEVSAPDLMRVWHDPNPGMSGAQLREMWATFYMIHGEGPLERVLVGSRARELYTLEPERMAVVPGSTGLPMAYEWKGPTGQTRRWPVNPVTGDSDVRFIKAANPIEPWRGLAPTWVAGRSIDANNAGSRWNAALLQNSAQPSGVLKVKGNLTDTQRERLKEQLEERYSGPRNARRPMVVEGDTHWQALSLTPVEMDWIEGNRETARAIALAYGVPPMLLGIPGDNTYSNYREARLALFDDTIIPLIKLFADELNIWIVPAFGNGIKLCPDYDSIEALDFRRESKWDRVQEADFLTIDEKRLALGYEKLGPERGGDIVPAVQRFAGLMFDMDDDPKDAGRRAYGDRT
jgi:HK97 family phage portal protein